MKSILLATVLALFFVSESSFAYTNVKSLSCQYQTGYGEATFFIGYDFDLETNNFKNQTTKGVGPLNQENNRSYSFLEGTLLFGEKFNYARFKPERVINGQEEFVLKCKSIPASLVTSEFFEFELISEDEIDGEMKSNLDFFNYCGNDTAIIKIDISKYVEAKSPWAYGKASLFGLREQFGPSVECHPGERARENYKILNQLLNEARSSNNSIDAKISIRKEQFSPMGYAIKLELYSKKLNKTFFFFDNLSALYKI